MIKKRYHLDELTQASEWILKNCSDKKVLCFYGEMGAGKTTLIKEICSQLGVHDHMSSPSFAIINQYLDAGGTEIYHFDFYRLKDVIEAVHIGAEDYFYSGNYCLIEWPEMVESLLPDHFVEINIKLVDKYQRLITINTE